MRILTFAALCLLAFGSLQTKAQQAPTQTDKDKEYRKKVSEIEEKNKKIAENNQKIQESIIAGEKAFSEKNYQLAIQKFDEGYNLDPDYPGTAPVLLRNKAIVLRTLGVEKYNNAINKKQNPAPEANEYFLDSVNALIKAKNILDNAPAPDSDLLKQDMESSKYNTVKELAESYRLLVLTDKTKINEAVGALENYINIEQDLLRKQQAQEKLKKLKTQFNLH